MTSPALPQAKEWNSYWSLDQTKKFTKVSWSKRRMISILEKYVREGACALDAGCGSGFFSKYFSDQKMRTTALDYSDEALRLTKDATAGRAKIIKENILSDSFSSSIGERFDLIFSDGLLEHFSYADQDRIIKNFLSVLHPDGLLVTFVPNRFSPWEMIRPFYMPGIKEDPFILSELVSLQRANQLSIVESGGINTVPFTWSPDAMIGKYLGMLLYTVSKLP